jgi:hypothetical protein
MIGHKWLWIKSRYVMWLLWGTDWLFYTLFGIYSVFKGIRLIRTSMVASQWVIALQTTGPSSRQRGRLTWRRKKVIVTQKHLKSRYGRQRGARHQEELAYWLSVAKSTSTSISVFKELRSISLLTYWKASTGSTSPLLHQVKQNNIETRLSKLGKSGSSKISPHLQAPS